MDDYDADDARTDTICAVGLVCLCGAVFFVTALAYALGDRPLL